METHAYKQTNKHRFSLYFIFDATGSAEAKLVLSFFVNIILSLLFLCWWDYIAHGWRPLENYINPGYVSPNNMLPY